MLSTVATGKMVLLAVLFAGGVVTGNRILCVCICFVFFFLLFLPDKAARWQEFDLLNNVKHASGMMTRVALGLPCSGDRSK